MITLFSNPSKATLPVKTPKATQSIFPSGQIAPQRVAKKDLFTRTRQALGSKAGFFLPANPLRQASQNPLKATRTGRPLQGMVAQAKRPAPLDAFVDKMENRETKALLKQLEYGVSPEAKKLLQGDYPQARKALVNIGTQMLTDIHNLRRQGNRDLQLVTYYHDPMKRTLTDPETGIKKEYSIPLVMLGRVATPVRMVKTTESNRYWQEMAQQLLQEEAETPMNFSELENEKILQAGSRQGFLNNNPIHRAEYLGQLLLMLRNLHDMWTEAPYENGHTSHENYHVGIAYTDKTGKPHMKKLDRLFPECELDDYNSQPDQQKLNLESQF